MGIIKRIFRKDKENGEPHSTPAASTLFHESDDTDGDSAASRNAPRRELVQVILRDTMRKHGIPSDWIDLRMLSTTTKSGRAGLHVSFIVKQAHDRLLTYVFAFQDSFSRELARFEPRATDWLLGLAWEFEGHVAPQKAAMPDPKVWIASGPAAIEPQGATPHSFAPTQDPLDEEPAPLTVEHDDVEEDLQALFAIRDAALARPEPEAPAAAAAAEADFEATRPGFDYDDEPPPGRS
jgi:hypothetical protein